jgi:predicted TIM-barrel fold metal-dependent hydrolase
VKIIDVHVYLGKWYFAIPHKGIGDVREILARYGVEKAILMSGMSIFSDFQRGNEILFAEIAPYDDLFGYCVVNGHYLKESMEEMERYLPLPKCRGIKFHPEYSAKRPDDADVMPLFEKLAYVYRKPALIHSWPYGEHGNLTPSSHPKFIARLASRIPDLKILMGHMGGPEWLEALKIAKPYTNLYVSICSSYTDFDKVKAAVDSLGAERVLFGSAMTYHDIAAQLGVVLDSEISDRDKEIVLYEGARKLFDM